MNVIIYTRVSTEDQSTAPQTLELSEYASRQGMTVKAEFSDIISGTRAKRPGLDAMLALVAQGGIDAILAVKLDRIGRSVLNVAQLMGSLDRLGCALICPGQGIDTRKSNAAGRLQLAMLSAVAAFERELIRERTIAGLRVARAKGIQLGRPSPSMASDPTAIVAAWRASNGSYRQLAGLLGGVSVSTAWRMAREVKDKTLVA
jgi:DNA invertase Pin-like site-specific DNA recombinase